MLHDIEHTRTVRDLEVCSDHELKKDTSYLILKGELWGIFCELFGYIIPQHIKSTMHNVWEIVPFQGITYFFHSSLHEIFIICIVIAWKTSHDYQ